MVCFFCSRSGFAPSMTFGEGNGRARRKQLSVVFTEAMSRVASWTSRVSQAKGDDTKADWAMKNPISATKESLTISQVVRLFSCLFDLFCHNKLTLAYQSRPIYPDLFGRFSVGFTYFVLQTKDGLGRCVILEFYYFL